METKDYIILTEEYRGDPLDGGHLDGGLLDQGLLDQGLLDLIHEGYVCVVDRDGKVMGSAGNPEAQVYYRSASKPLQAIPVIARGLHKKYGLTEEETVIFSGSHLGEEFHMSVLESIFRKAGIPEDELIMKPAVPGSAKANEERIRKGLPMRKLYHNCSGKHAALMLLQRELTGSVQNYWQVDCPAQKEVLRTIATLSQFPEDKIDIGIDGCGVPVFAVPMRNIAVAFKNLARPEDIEDEVLRAAAEEYVPLIHKYPLMMRGTSYICSLINYDENIVAKGGANGVYGLGLKKEGIGISFKLKDGTETMWPIILREIFRQIGYNQPDTIKMLEGLHSGVITNDNGTEVGRCKAVFRLGL